MTRSWLDLVTGPAAAARQAALAAWGLCWLRVTTGLLMLVFHGWPKLQNFGDLSGRFPDPLGIGSAASLTLAVFAEFFCSLALILGLATRLAAVPLVITMLVAAFIVHADDPWSRQEFPLLYALGFVALAIGGAGKASLDGWLRRRRDH
jgi:putative oxidoreductase